MPTACPTSCRRWIPAALSAALSLALYAITLGGTYIYDDAAIIGTDPRAQSPKLWYQFWTHDYFNGGLDNLYRPLVSQTYGFERWLHPNLAWPYHLVNILLHAGAAALVAELGRRLAGWRVGLIAGLLFAAHPIHSEAVAGIVGRAELMCAIGVLGGLVLFLHRPMTQPRALAIFLLCVMAMLSKEQGMLMPALLAILLPVRRAVLFVEDERTPQQRYAERQAMMLVFALVMWPVIGLIWLREEFLKLKFEWDRGFLDIAMQPLIKSPPVDRWLIPIALLGRYFQLLIAPVKLSIDYGLSVIGSTISRSDPYLWLGAAVLIAWILLFCVTLIRRRWAAAFCLLAMALTYSMASNAIIIATIFGERLMYLPSAFFLILMAMAIAKLPAKWPGILLAIFLILGCLRTWTYIEKWNNRDEFYAYSLQQQPMSLKMYLLMAHADFEENKFAQARELTDKAIAIYPGYWELWKLSALIDVQTNDWDRAVTDWQKAFDLEPSESLVAQLEIAMGMRNKLHATTRNQNEPPIGHR